MSDDSSCAHAGDPIARAIALIGSSGLGTLPAGNLSVPSPFSQRICLVEDCSVAGTTHVSDIDEMVAKLRKDQELRFVRDADNRYDHWCIQVLSPEGRLGYVPADTNEILARLMDGGKRLLGIVGEVEHFGGWNKIHMGVFLDD